jgi:diguanylate cyclase
MIKTSHNNSQINSSKKIQINSELIEEGLDKDEFSLHYQLQSCLKTGKIVSMEALSRWQSPALGKIDTVDLIRVLEDSAIDLIAKFHEWVFAQLLVKLLLGKRSAYQFQYF